jgi:hypothetical protein
VLENFLSEVQLNPSLLWIVAAGHDMELAASPDAAPTTELVSLSRNGSLSR